MKVSNELQVHTSSVYKTFHHEQIALHAVAMDFVINNSHVIVSDDIHTYVRTYVLFVLSFGPNFFTKMFKHCHE